MFQKKSVYVRMEVSKLRPRICWEKRKKPVPLCTAISSILRAIVLFSQILAFVNLVFYVCFKA